MENLNIKTGISGFYCFFTTEGQEYCADVCAIPFLEHANQCAIWKAKDGEVIDWNPVFIRKDVPVTTATLRECVGEFAGALVF